MASHNAADKAVDALVVARQRGGQAQHHAPAGNVSSGRAGRRGDHAHLRRAGAGSAGDALSIARMAGDARHTISEAHRLDMGVDMPTGTGWPFGGPQVTDEDAEDKLVIANRSCRRRQTFNVTYLARTRRRRWSRFPTQGESVSAAGQTGRGRQSDLDGSCRRRLDAVCRDAEVGGR